MVKGIIECLCNHKNSAQYSCINVILNCEVDLTGCGLHGYSLVSVFFYSRFIKYSTFLYIHVQLMWGLINFKHMEKFSGRSIPHYLLLNKEGAQKGFAEHTGWMVDYGGVA